MGLKCASSWQRCIQSPPPPKVKEKEIEYVLVGDKAYPFSDKPEGWSWRVTKTAEEEVDEVGGEGEKKVKKKASSAGLSAVYFDSGIARLRGVVERSIGKIKEWRIFHNLDHCFNFYHVEDNVVLSTGLLNWMMSKRGMNQI
jgi:hypothetical protein